jgi:hypothetical protein
MVAIDGGGRSSTELVPVQSFPPEMNDIFEFAMVRLDNPTAYRRAWLDVSKSPDDDRTFLQRIFDEDPVSGEPSIWLIAVCGIGSVLFAIFMAYAFAQEDNEPPIPGPHVQ